MVRVGILSHICMFQKWFCTRSGNAFGISMVCPAVYVIILSVKSRHNFVELHDEYFTYSVDGAKGQVDYSDIAAIVLRGNKKFVLSVQ